MRLNGICHKTEVMALCLLLAFAVASPGYAVTPAQIVTEADKRMMPIRQSFTIDVDIVSPSENLGLRLYSSSGNTIVVYLRPETEAGKVLLLSGGLWLFTQNSKRGVLMTQVQRLSGAITLGDVLFVKLSEGYVPALNGETDKEYSLTLTASAASMPYQKIDLFVEKGTFRPLKAKVYAMSGKPLRTVLFSRFSEIEGKLMATELRFIDHLYNEEETVMKFSKIKTSSLPNNYFSRTTLPALIPQLLRM